MFFKRLLENDLFFQKKQVLHRGVQSAGDMVRQGERGVGTVGFHPADRFPADAAGLGQILLG